MGVDLGVDLDAKVTQALNVEAQDRCPDDFQYWDNLDRPSVKKMRSLLKFLVGFDPVLPDDRIREFAQSYYASDPIAEAVITDLYKPGQAGKARDVLLQALEQGVESLPDAPPSLVTLFDELDSAPSWMDAEKVDHGARVFRRYGWFMFHFLGAITLEGYRESSVAKPLAFTGAYDGSTAYKRFLETCNFWNEVAQPGGLDKGGKGRTTAVRVRVMHVVVRRHLANHKLWDEKAWGVPISQADSMVTLAAGSVGLGLGLKKMGFRFDKKDIEALLHFWRYVGYLMGVQPRWYPESYEDGVRFFFTIFAKGVKGSGEDGTRLSQGYLKAFEPDKNAPLWKRFKQTLNYRYQVGMTQYFITPQTHKHYGLPEGGLWKWFPATNIPFVFALETARKNSRPLDDWLDKKVRQHSDRWLKQELGQYKPQYKPVDKLTR